MNLERNLAEMARGKLVQQRAERLDQLQRWEKARKIHLVFNISSNHRQAWLFKGGTFFPPAGTLLAECEDSNDYPTEAFVAQVALGIQALSNFEGVKEPEQREKSEAAKHVIDGKKWAPA